MGGSGESGTVGGEAVGKSPGGIIARKRRARYNAAKEAFMKNFACVLGMALLPGLAIAAENPDWAYPATPKPAPLDNVVQKQMPGSAKKYTQAQIDAGLKPGVWTKVVETATVPKSYVGSGAMRFAAPEGGTEPIGNRIIVLPQDAVRAHSRDPHSGFIDYVPVGSLAKGKALVTSGGSGQTVPCAICHGASLKGLGEVPGITGRPPIYVVRQLNDMQNGNRTGSLAELMKAVVAKLSIEDMVAIAAYLGSLEP